ncbi:unnamed protein product [Microthlaspi erraticum]|uniref:Uncharacterized protein n=1 Tax=Microthlaspi erraticum TaxID=1685480 RepID=A0A6D2IJE7_9BRAS|nr:unnamed protein product [Microthlaspi erraticum]
MPTKERSSDVHAKPSIKGSDVHANPAQATTLAIIVNPAKATTPTFTQNPTQARRNKDLTVIFCPWDKRAMAGPNCFTHVNNRSASESSADSSFTYAIKASFDAKVRGSQVPACVFATSQPSRNREQRRKPNSTIPFC